jgi:NADPH:quinone reductase-like Zn-dependent oxidoreductase
VYRLHLILGNDLAGTVIRVGAKVRGFQWRHSRERRRQVIG